MTRSRCCTSLVGVLALLVVVVCVPVVSSKPAAGDMHCFNFDRSCSQCIQEASCQWCAKPTGSDSKHHCFATASNLTDTCHADDIENPQSDGVKLIKDQPLTVAKRTNEDHIQIVQLKPQHISIKLRKGVPVNVTVSYRQVKDYPLDLYYLMDLSKSMEGDKDTLASLGQELARTMRELTSQFKIGFGSFVDKVMLPFVNIHPESMNNPCSKCDPAFSFRNNFKLSTKDAEFTENVKAAQISSNLDSPEGGFDALMQAMVCEKEIGWRNNVRKIIVFSTDALFHMAGDGKLAGVIQPNDGRCHLDENGFYQKYNEFDYPSIGHINEVAQSKGFNIIFAVKGHPNIYQRLSGRIKGSVYQELDSSSTNVIDVVAQVYRNISGIVEMDVKASDRDVPIFTRFFTNCGNSKNSLEETNRCEGVTEGSTFDFTVELKATECSRKKSTSLTIGTLQDSLVVDIELLCDCKCENPNHKGYKKNSESCSSNGIKQCGVCSCNEGFYGEVCLCSKNDKKATAGNENDLSKCRPEGSNATVSVCSARGTCECETCTCWDESRHHGKFCQCNRDRCTHSLGSKLECSGNGQCGCNSCKCNPGWEGRLCGCRSKQNCIPPNSKVACSGHGECNCGDCDCQVTYTGKYCEECPKCAKGKCLEYRSCVQCKIWGSGPLKDACDTCNITNIQQLPSLDSPLKRYATLCTFVDDLTGCDFNFTYRYIGGDYYEIFAQNQQKCFTINLMAAIFGVIGAVVAIGVLTLVIWKILTTIHDRREFERFQDELKNPKWTTNQNPMYASPKTVVTNPAFKGN